MGFSGTVGQGTAEAAGLTTLAGDSFGGGPQDPDAAWHVGFRRDSDPTEEEENR